MVNSGTVVVHIGTEKTGTSTIQEFLNLNRSALAHEGVGFLKSPGRRNNRKIATYCMSLDRVDDYVRRHDLAAKSSRKRWKDKTKRELGQEIKSLKKENVHSFIISSEHLHSRLQSRAEIQNLSHLLEGYFSDIKIIVYLRRQDQLITSLSATSLVDEVSHHVLNNDGSCPDNVSKDDWYYNYRNLLENWSGVFGATNVVPRVFDKAMLVEGDLIKDFKLHSGLFDKGWELQIPEDRNRSSSLVSQEVVRIFNQSFPNLSKSNKFARSIRTRLLERLDNEFPGPPRMPIRAEAMRFYNIFREDNKRLSQRWFSVGNVFSEDFSMYPENPMPVEISTDVLNTVFHVLAKVTSEFQLPKEKRSSWSTLLKKPGP